MSPKPAASNRWDVFEPGMTIDDDLTVAEHLGGSRKIDIYLCRSRKHDGLVACKILRARYAIDYSSLEAVMDEGHRLIGLNHPNVIEGYSVELLPYPRIVLEYLTGDTISNTFFRGNYGAFDVEDFVLVIEQLCDAVTYVHSQGMLHLDVKPANVMYDDGQVTLFDFSVAEEFSPDQTLRDNAGTTEYMAPEQALRRSLGYFTDVFGIGVVLYRLLAGGELPYGVIEGPLPGYDESRKQLGYSLPPPRPSSLNPQVSSALDDVVLKALSPEKSERHPDPETLKREILEAFWKEYDED